MVGASELVASAAFSGVLRAAAVPSQGAQSVLDAYAGVYTTAGAVSHSVSDFLVGTRCLCSRVLLLARHSAVRQP